MKSLSFILLMLASSCSLLAGQQPQVKVDLSIANRSDDETLEPGYIVWRVGQGAKDSMTIDNISYTFSTPSGVDYILRGGWNKTFIQGAENKAKNGRLTGDGLSLDPATEAGQIDLTIAGLPAGTHTLQTYHNRWENPANFNGWPIFVAVNGSVVHSKVETSFCQNIAADATLLTTSFTVPQDGEEVRLSFYTLENEKPADLSKSKNNKAPIINGFELNTISVLAQAKNPCPSSGDVHVDSKDGSLSLSWSPADGSVISHLLYFGKDSAEVAQMSTPTIVNEASDTAWHVSDLYSMDTYWWRVDEVDASGRVTQGNVWNFRLRQLAFPGAEGYGRFATGGRGGVVYHVTNLRHDTLPGSFLYGLKKVKGPRTIVFDVSGIIEWDFGAVFSDPYVTIAAQTAPGKGVCLKYCNLGLSRENICRFLRAKRGYGGSENTGNAMGLGSDQVMVDHCTAAWGTDETVSGRGARNVSFQYNIIAEALGIADHANYSPGTNHGYAATIDGKIGSWHHNLLVNCEGRNWSMGGGMDGTNTAIGQMDIFNNVCYNWHSRTTDGGCHEVNFVNNYYKMGPDTSKKILFSQDYENIGSQESTWQAYISGNIRENKNGTLTTDKEGDTYRYTLSNGASDPNKRTDEYAYKTFVSAPFFPSYAEIHTAQEAFKIVNSYAGAYMPCRDEQHKRVVTETVTGTYTFVGSKSGIKGEIDREADCGGFESYPEEHRDADFDPDQDGIPSWFERIVGTDSYVANNNEDPDCDGWTQLEDYLDFMAHPYSVLNAGEKVEVDVSEFFAGFVKSPSYSVSVFMDTDVTATISGTTLSIMAGANSTITSLTLTVKDNEGTQWSRRYNVAVSGQRTGIETKRAAYDSGVCYDLSGRRTCRSGWVIRSGRVIRL